MSKKKIIAIVGTTASGKTGLAVELAYSYNGEVVSADSRQVYKFMDIGSGKDLDEYSYINEKNETVDIPYHLIDVVSPNEKFDLAQWLVAAKKAIDDINKKNKIAIIAGGTGLYSQALIDGYQLTNVKPDRKLRSRLESKTNQELQKILAKKNQSLFEKLNKSDMNNQRRLIRYIEIENGKKYTSKKVSKESSFDSLVIAITRPREDVKKRIKIRLHERLEKENMIEEVENLLKVHKVSHQRLEEFGLEYKYISLYLQGKLNYDEMLDRLYIAICQFSKRQMTWLRRWEKQGQEIHWIGKNKDAHAIVKNFLK